MRIGKKKQKKNAHTKGFARLVDSENWSKKVKAKDTKKNTHKKKSVARLVDSENWFSQKIKTNKHAHKKSVARLVDSENWSRKNTKIIQKTTTRAHTKCC